MGWVQGGGWLQMNVRKRPKKFTYLVVGIFISRSRIEHRPCLPVFLLLFDDTFAGFLFSFNIYTCTLQLATSIHFLSVLYVITMRIMYQL